MDQRLKKVTLNMDKSKNFLKSVRQQVKTGKQKVMSNRAMNIFTLYYHLLINYVLFVLSQPKQNAQINNKIIISPQCDIDMHRSISVLLNSGIFYVVLES